MEALLFIGDIAAMIFLLIGLDRGMRNGSGSLGLFAYKKAKEDKSRKGPADA